ncbi:MAG: hypothetical protein PUD80_06545 [Firmicutes bacterium]|nr:hypothetical protein [Bacillota bacterium]
MPQYEFAETLRMIAPQYRHLISQKSKIFASFPKGEAFDTPYRAERYPMA